MGGVHDRMPVILSPDIWTNWLSLLCYPITYAGVSFLSHLRAPYRVGPWVEVLAVSGMTVRV